jgi:hypothetical protein
MSGATKKIEEAAKSLEAGLIKKAVLLTDSSKTEKAHKIVVDIAKQCVANKEDCKDFCKEGAVKLKDMITPTTDNNDDLEEILAEEEGRTQNAPSSQESPPSPDAPTSPDKPVAEMSDDEAFNNCEECNIAAAAATFVKIAQKDECDGNKALAKLQPCVDDNMTTPEKWLKTMAEVAENATCDKLKYGEVLGELTDYLQKRDSPILKNLDKPV